ncbi:MAG TPA: hypothetical protein VF092_19895 [Longimicrobium sp.]
MQTTTPPAAMPLWLPFLFPVFFAGMWLFVTYLLAVLSGWRALARRYRAQSAAGPWTAPWASGYFNWFGLPVGFSSCLNVGVSARGVVLRPVLVFAAGAPRLEIPWEEMMECRSWRLFGIFPRFSFVTAGPRVKITLVGRAGALLDDVFARELPGRAAAGA